MYKGGDEGKAGTRYNSICFGADLGSTMYNGKTSHTRAHGGGGDCSLVLDGEAELIVRMPRVSIIYPAWLPVLP